ncbi:MAG: hypothetical protein A2268_07215 [Candidatus Raymondbacteria bacterium RifOxyA12_full_50_37]|uniref:HTH cro/C1-type domain-containing protein n=1 Tax=Candidatus Raymondbacteria bacterium RIFOXYD12_FULL_49_13 TaxID=1817890 RepID=A0A1F7FF05_UNCRA|nr:MAG: hypothetical protein A2350_11155 [Candidatus Raymondbacteria bacterium RifOxyB12_full_50_8]OGJ89763.1 MAG: hypothetical protein A2268_07215 [Candidatus Raymondbacteria bacterium RifOxyA12_full_50_37]OGJ91171.1 MAG: hypothetical protein A2248_01360 [Candidatus Raymondbacteria bacterium RIFOXYA2_FULL_49_16]OGJ96304.1 MAG: hypothetical protein A2487_00570 [Candidatus Raymondbacteria bacterium RifOxyC12_full_50_8]OGJ97569.1 MAG: hypothetical protein A2453_02125 [Candidatus Raymondbacteria b
MKKNLHYNDDALAHLEELKAKDPEGWKNYDIGLQTFKISVLLKQFREDSGLNQEQLADFIHITKQAVSKLENHGEDIRLSTLWKVANATGHKVAISIKRTGTVHPPASRHSRGRSRRVRHSRAQAA